MLPRKVLPELIWKGFGIYRHIAQMLYWCLMYSSSRIPSEIARDPTILSHVYTHTHKYINVIEVKSGKPGWGSYQIYHTEEKKTMSSCDSHKEEDMTYMNCHPSAHLSIRTWSCPLPLQPPESSISSVQFGSGAGLNLWPRTWLHSFQQTSSRLSYMSTLQRALISYQFPASTCQLSLLEAPGTLSWPL